jgi:co-chaperonin GroES (HSP10)
MQMKYKIKPILNQILIQPIAKEQVLVSDRESLCEYGEVIAKGSQVSDAIKVGDIIGHVIWGLKHLEVDGVKYYFVPEDEDVLLCILEKDEKKNK